MTEETIRYYNKNSDYLFRKYNDIDVSVMQENIRNHLRDSTKVLEIGSGSGRDIRYMLDNGFDVIGIDGSKSLVELSIKNFPQLKNRIIQSELPNEFPIFKNKFNGLYSIATLMHFTISDVEIILKKVHAVMGKNSPVYISVSGKRNYDNSGRLFLTIGKEKWISIFKDNGFVIKEVVVSTDILNRNITWYNFLMKTE